MHDEKEMSPHVLERTVFHHKHNDMLDILERRCIGSSRGEGQEGDELVHHRGRDTKRRLSSGGSCASL